MNAPFPGPIRTVCAAALDYGAEAFATLGPCRILEPARIGRAMLADIDALAIRSTTRVNADLLAGTPVRFVGTATIGFDHIDTAWLAAHGIRWAHAPGSNADSVAEYIVAALLHLATRHGLPLQGRTLGIIGVGNVGRRVAARAPALGLTTLLNDPPRAAGNEPDAPPFVPLEELLARADIVTLHVPLEDGGRWPTRHMAGDAFFRAMKPGAVFINAARGAVMDSAALASAIRRGPPAFAVLDTWEGEPAIDPELLACVTLATPHIAGYSFDGKVNGTRMIYESLCAFADRAPAWTPVLPPPPVPSITVAAGHANVHAALDAVVRRVYDITEDDRALRTVPVGVSPADHFSRLRRDYRQRREFPHTVVHLPGDSLSAGMANALRTLGFRVAPA